MTIKTAAMRAVGLTILIAGILLLTLAPASGHHRRHYPYHFAAYPGATVAVYRCSPVSASVVQTVVANYNANGGIGTTLTYGGDSCTSTSGILVKEDTSLGSGVGFFQYGLYSNRAKEIMKDAYQLGRVYYRTIAGQYKLTGGTAWTYSGSSYSVIAHEIGHGLGLHEAYVDVTGIDNCANPSYSTVMDCSGSDTGPLSYDAANLYSRWSTSPWGTGAIWITNDSGSGDTTITLNWADINDNETSHSLYKNGAFLQYANGDAESANISGLSGGECFYIVASNGIGTNTSSQICRSAPSAPSAPSGASTSYGANHYTAHLSWTTNAAASAYTHEFVAVYDGGGALRAQYYVPHHGTGGYTHTITLGRDEGLPSTFSMDVTTCNQKYNAWSGFGCIPYTSASLYLYYP